MTIGDSDGERPDKSSARHARSFDPQGSRRQRVSWPGISRRIEQITHGTFQVKPGSLFPALHRMEEAGWLKSFWGESVNHRRAKFYKRTKAGERQLGVETEQWATIAQAMANALKAS